MMDNVHRQTQFTQGFSSDLRAPVKPFEAARTSLPLPTERTSVPFLIERTNAPLPTERTSAPLPTERTSAPFLTERHGGYTIITNTLLRERSLSLRAKGLLSLIISLPPSWSFSVRGLATLSSDGVDSTRAAVRELEQKGYLVRPKEKRGFARCEWRYFLPPIARNAQRE